MLLGFEYQPDPTIAAKQKRQIEDEPHQSPMRANGEVIRRNPSNDQLKKRRELARGRRQAARHLAVSDVCTRCGKQIYTEDHDGKTVWVDNSGGDVCGVDGGNEPHAPSLPTGKEGSLNIWGQNHFVTADSTTPIAYTYEADYHCPECTEKRFGRGSDGYIAGETDGHFPEDDEGNEVHAVFPTDEWWEPSEPGRQVLTCGTCGREIDEIDGDEVGEFEGSLKTAVDLGRDLVGEKVMVTFTYENQGSQQMTRRMMLRDPEAGWSGEPGKYRFTDLDAGTEVFLAPEDIINITPAEGTTSTKTAADSHDPSNIAGERGKLVVTIVKTLDQMGGGSWKVVSYSPEGGLFSGYSGRTRAAAEARAASYVTEDQPILLMYGREQPNGDYVYDEPIEKSSARTWTCSECGHKNQGGSVCAECGFHYLEDERNDDHESKLGVDTIPEGTPDATSICLGCSQPITHFAYPSPAGGALGLWMHNDTHDIFGGLDHHPAYPKAAKSSAWWETPGGNTRWLNEQKQKRNEYYKNNPDQEPGPGNEGEVEKQATDEAESNLEDGNALQEVEPGSKNDKPMWPWELTDKNPDSGVSDTKTSKTAWNASDTGFTHARNGTEPQSPNDDEYMEGYRSGKDFERLRSKHKDAPYMSYPDLQDYDKAHSALKATYGPQGSW